MKSKKYSDNKQAQFGQPRKTLIALGLASLLPSLVFSDENNENLKHVLASTPQILNEKSEDYSTITNLRAIQTPNNQNSNLINYENDWKITEITQSFPKTTQTFNQNTNIKYTGTGKNAYIGFTANNNSIINMTFESSTQTTNVQGSTGIWTHNATGGSLFFRGNGSFNVIGNYTGSDVGSLFSPANVGGMEFSIESRFSFQAQGHLGRFLSIYGYGYGAGRYFFNSPFISINMKTSTSGEKYIIHVRNGDPSNIYINANKNSPTSIDNQASITQLTGDIYLSNAILYMHITNPSSFLQGNLTPVSGTSTISFSNGSAMVGNINIQGNGTHSITFNNSSFQGLIQSSSTNNINTTITFTNTSGKTFGSSNNGVVDSSYAGKIIGTFDLSSTSGSTIRGGNDGSKGFLGNGTNILTFDFKNKAFTSSNAKFTVANGNADSIYTLSGFSSGGLLDLNTSSSLFSMLNNAGVIFSPTTNGKLVLKNTNVQVGSGDKALFASMDNLAGSGVNTPNLAYSALFGNAIWNDLDNDGGISANEIINNSGGINYKLTSSSSQTGNNITTNTSTGDIGTVGDNFKKQVAFIFGNNNGYTFGGDTQGYSGTISGGTPDSKYYFANAGYINRTQIDNALGDLVLFNTAFRGDLGVSNKDVSISLDFSNNRNGLRAESGNGNSNIVGSGSKNIIFDFTNNTKALKFEGAVVGAASNATYTLINLKKYSSDDVLDGDGTLKVTTTTRNAGSKTLIDAIQEAGLSNFNQALSSWSNGYGDGVTNIDSLTNSTTLSLRGTSLDVTNIDFSNYKYILTFGENLDNYNGYTIANSKLTGLIDLTSNSQTGHSFYFKGDSVAGTESGVLANVGALSGFSFDDSGVVRSEKVTFKLSGLDQNHYVSNSSSSQVQGDALVFTNTSLEGNLWADNSVTVDLDFRDGRTWKMDSSGIDLKNGGDLIIFGAVDSLSSSSTAPTLKVKANTKVGKINLINTELDTTFQLTLNYNQQIAETFNLRGTSFRTYSGSQGGKLSGVVESGSFNMVFAHGNQLQSTLSNGSGGYYNITDAEIDSSKTYEELYQNDSYHGNYIAPSQGAIIGSNTNSGINLTFIGHDSWNTSETSISDYNYVGRSSTLALINASDKWNAHWSNNNVLGISAGYIGKFFQRSVNTRTDIVIEGTSIDWGNEGGSGGIVRRTSDQGSLNFTMTFINEGENDSNNTDKTYVGDKYTDFATTNANGALSDSVLKVQESKLVSGLNFKGANATVTFIGDEAQSLDGSAFHGYKILQGGSSSSIFTFRDSNLNAGNGTSSIQSIAGTIAFDLTHTNEDMEISGTLKNMLASGGKHQVQFSGKDGSKVNINALVFADVNDLASSAITLSALGANGNYFSDEDVFGNLSSKDYSALAALNNVDSQNSSSLSFAQGASVALESGEVFFVGENSHNFDSSDSAIANKLANSTGGTLTFIDAGILKIDNLLNISNGVQEGKGVINLIGNTNIELQNINSKKTLSLKKDTATGEGITINAVFTGTNPLGASSNGIEKDSTHSTSTANIGQEGETTVYNILFDYTSSNLVFGLDHAYSGEIIGLTEASTIKFKNAGYIYDNQILNTKATILVDNTQIRGDFRGDVAVLDFRYNNSSIAGNILSSDITNDNLSQKKLTFDLTGTSYLSFPYSIQVGNKVAPDYTQTQASTLIFQNATNLTIGNDGNGSNPSDFLKALASDLGFSTLSNAKTSANGYTSTDKSSYVLEGTILKFQGTNITASNTNQAITENTYDLSLNFDARSSNRGITGLGETLQTSSLSAYTINMGDNRNLALSFKNVGSLSARSIAYNNTNFNNVLNINLGNNAGFNLDATSDNGNIGTVVLNTTSSSLAQESSLNISAGSLNFVGSFIQGTGSGTAGNISANFNGTNKAYGVISGNGEMNITLSGNALLSKAEAEALGYSTPTSQFADLVIDTSSASSSNLSLTYNSGTLGVIGANITGSNQTYTTLNLNNANGDLALKGAFDLGNANITYNGSSKTLTLVDNTFFKTSNGSSITLSNAHVDQPTTLSITAIGNQTNFVTNLTLTNLDPNLTVELTTPSGSATIDDWGNKGVWNIRGTNIKLSTAFWAENNTNLKQFVFAKGSGTQTTQTDSSGSTLKLSELTDSNKINESALSGNIAPATGGSGSSQNTRNIIMKNGVMTFIGKESLQINNANQIIDGTGGTTTFNFYNSILASGAIILNNTNNGGHPSLGASAAISDVANILGTDTFNLSVSKSNGATGANNSTINATFINDDNTNTGERYISSINSNNQAYMNTISSYATNNAGGALSENILQTLTSKAYGNITLDNTVTANMKFIGENSHSFDGKTKVDGSGDSATFYYTNDDVNWFAIQNNQGVITLSSTSTTPSGALATLSGGNANSRFDFNHTSIKLEQVKDAGGNTYVYNSNIIGELAVSSNANNGSTTLFFNQAFTKDSPLSSTAQKFVTLYADKGIDLVTNTAHTLQSSHLGSNGKLSNTSKTTNLILIGKNAFEGTQEGDDGINLSFLPDTLSSSNYNYTIVSGGMINIQLLEDQLGAPSNGTYPDSNIQATIFGNSKVQLIDTYAIGNITFGQVGFIDVKNPYNQKSKWSGNTDQFLIFNFNNAQENNKLYEGQTPALQNTSANTHYIFTGFFKNSDMLVNNNVLAINGENGLKGAINAQLGSAVIDSSVVGFLGTRGVSIEGDIIENTTGGNNVDIVFNSTDNLAYQEYFDESGNHIANIVEAPNYVSTGIEDNQIISGYAQLRPKTTLNGATTKNSVTIGGNSTKQITFIGNQSVSLGFDHLYITEGSIESKYTFHTVGHLSNIFFDNISTANPDGSRSIALGTFKFINSFIESDINFNANSADNNSSNEARLIFENVHYSGKLSGNLIKQISFGDQSGHIIIEGGNNASSYDFSNFKGKSVTLDINMNNAGTSTYQSPSIIGFDGDISLQGSLNLALNNNELAVYDENYSNNFAFNDNAKWIVTDSSRVMNLALSNSQSNYNLDLASASRDTGYRTLSVGSLSSSGGQALLGVSINLEDQASTKDNADKIVANNLDGTLYVTAVDTSLESAVFDTSSENAIVLVQANSTGNNGSVVGATHSKGLSYITTKLEHQVTYGDGVWYSVDENNSASSFNTQRWVLSELSGETNQALVDESTFIISNPYYMLLIESNNLNKRMGELRDNPYTQGAWIRVFNGMDSGEGIKNLYTNIQLGYDYATAFIGAKNYTGVALSTSVVDISGDYYSGKANTYSLAVYNSYIADSGFYVDSIFKYMYNSQSLTPAEGSSTNFGNHAYSLGLELGYRQYLGETHFYVEGQVEAIAGIVQKIDDVNLGVVGGMNITGNLKTTLALDTRVGLVSGYTLKTQSGFGADFRIGASLVNENSSQNDNIILKDGITQSTTALGNDTKVVVSVGTNLIVTDQWRVYLDAERSFGGKRNTDYQANIGARFSFGEILKPLPKPQTNLPVKIEDEKQKDQ